MIQTLRGFMDGVPSLRMISSAAIRRRLLAFSAISILAGWANYEAAPRGVEIAVVNGAGAKPGGQVFESLMGHAKALALLTDASNFARTLLYANAHDNIKPVRRIVLCVDACTGAPQENVIRLKSRHIEECGGDVEQQIRGFIYGEVARIWLWDAAGHAPRGLIHAIAHYVRLRAGVPPSECFDNADGSDAWDSEGGQMTAQFVAYCESLRPGFVGDLNGRLEQGWNDSVFQDLLAANVSQLWRTFSGIRPLRQLPNVSAYSSSAALV